MEPIFTAEQLAEVKAYHQPYYLWSAVSDVVRFAAYLSMVVVFLRPLYRAAVRVAGWLDARSARVRALPVLRALFVALDRLWGGKGWGAAVLFALFNYLALRTAFMPLNIYLNYVHQHRHGLSTYTPWTFAVDELKAIALVSVATAAVAFGLYGLARRVASWWLLLGGAAAALMVFSSVLDPLRAQIFFEHEPLAEGALSEGISALMKKADVEFAGVRIENSSRATKSLDAYFAGQGPTRTIVLTDTLLANMTDREVLAAVAHEVAHVREQKWPRRVAAALACVAFLFLVDRLFRLSARRGWFGTTDRVDIRTLPLVTFAFYVLTTAVNPVSLAFSRAKEREADRYALELTGDREALRSMLIKAARVNKMDPTPPRWLVLKGYSHPPVSERIAAVDAL